MIIFSIIHPSRGRAIRAAATCEKWLDNYNGYNGAEYIVSIDNDERDFNKYEFLFNQFKKKYPSIVFKIVNGKNNNVVDAMNAGAKHAQGKILIGVSDDFDCFADWNLRVLESIDQDKEQALLVNQGIKEYTTNMALPIMTKKLYDRLKYIYYPLYSGMFADDDIVECCRSMGVLKTRNDLIFQHNHFINGKAVIDDTYKRHNTKQSWDLGTRILAQRRIDNFTK